MISWILRVLTMNSVDPLRFLQELNKVQDFSFLSALNVESFELCLVMKHPGNVKMGCKPSALSILGVKAAQFTFSEPLVLCLMLMILKCGS